MGLYQVIPKNPYLEGTPDEFFRENERLVHYAIKKYVGVIKDDPSVEYDDLVNIGMMGMMKAYERFDPKKSTAKFSTYAISMIRWEVLIYFENNLDMIRFPKSAKKTYNEIWEKDLLHLSVKELSEELSETTRIIQQALDYGTFQDVGSLDIPRYNDEGGISTTIGETIPVDVDYDSTIIMEDFLSILTDEEKEVTNLVCEGYSQNEISKRIGHSQSTVSIIYQGILEKAENYRSLSKEKIEKKKLKNTENKLLTFRAKTGEEGKEMSLTQQEIQGFKNAFWKEKEEKHIEDLEKARALIKDIQLTTDNISDITNVNRGTIEEMRKSYLGDISDEETSTAIRELLHSTKMTSESICDRLQCDEKDVIKEQKRITSMSSVNRPLSTEHNIKICLENDKISIKEAKRMLDSVEQLGVGYISIRVSNPVRD